MAVSHIVQLDVCNIRSINLNWRVYIVDVLLVVKIGISFTNDYYCV